MTSSDSDRRHILATFLRAHRERLRPDPSLAGRRRTPGLRREEVAFACGMSTTWYTWLEQGRAVSVSASALSRLCGALRLGPAERTYVFDLAGKADPIAPVDGPIDLPDEVWTLPAAMAVPAYLLDRSWTARAWNALAADLFPGWLDQGSDRNLLRFVFLHPAARTLIADWEERARRIVAEFRADAVSWSQDATLQALVADLHEASPAFRRHWQEQAVLHREGGERRFNHPVRGPCLYRQATFLLAGHSDVKLVSLTPTATASGNGSGRTNATGSITK